ARARHQRRECVIHAERALAFQDVGVERIEGEERAVIAAAADVLRIDAALRRADIDVREVLEVGGIEQIAEGRHAVPLGGLRRGGQLRGGPGAYREHQRVSACDHTGTCVPYVAWVPGLQRTANALRCARDTMLVFVSIITSAAAPWPPSRRPTTRWWGSPSVRISACSPDGRSGPTVRCV